jgi:hypothetical protein
MKYWQQGDCLIKETKIPRAAKIAKTDILWQGANHHHRVKGKFKIKKDGDKIYLDSSGCTLFHEEHKDIDIPKGQYFLEIVKEYDHLLEEARQVID